MKVKKTTSLNVFNFSVCRVKMVNFTERNAKRTHLYSRWAYKRRGGGLYPGGLISVGKWMAYIRGGLKTGGALKWVTSFSDILSVTTIFAIFSKKLRRASL